MAHKGLIEISSRICAHRRTRTHAHTNHNIMNAAHINILIACEESQAECMAFRNRGFNAYSSDLQKARFNPSWHIQGDVTPYLHGETDFYTEDGKHHHVEKWHMIIAHPPCTYLCKVSAVQLSTIKTEAIQVPFNGQIKTVDRLRYEKMIAGRKFFFECLNAKTDFLAVENPLPMALAELPRPSSFIHPSWFGVKYTKKTLFWLKNLPPLMAELEFPNPKEFVHCSRGKYRSRTFPQVADAIAKQWGDYILNEL